MGSVYYLNNRKMLFLVEHAKMEINTEFHYKKYIKEVVNGKKSDVTCQSGKLDITKLGVYEIIFNYRGRDYPFTIEVVDTTKPKIKELMKLNVLMNTEVDLNKGMEISDDSGIYPRVTIDSSQLDTSQVGEYIVEYRAQDQSGNVSVFYRKIHVMKEIGTSQ